MTLREATLKALDLAEEFAGIHGSMVSIGVDKYSEEPRPKVNVHATESTREAIFRLALKKCGKIEKGKSASHGRAGDVDLILFSALECKVIGTKKQPKMRFVDTGEEEEVNVYECHAPIGGTE